MRRVTGRPPAPKVIPFDADASIAVHVATQEAARRGTRVEPLHLLYGLLRTEPFLQAIERLDIDTRAVTKRIAAALDQPMSELIWRIHSVDELRLRQRPPFLGNDYLVAITSAANLAHSKNRTITAVDFWATLSRSGAGTALLAAGVNPLDILFVMVHGEPPQALARIVAPTVDVVIRDDDYSSVDLVHRILGPIFGLPADSFTSITDAVQKDGSGVIAHLPLDDARNRVHAARQLARDKGLPLWIGLRDPSLAAPYR